jgi:predicted PurR-regulated permease PerM
MFFLVMSLFQFPYALMISVLIAFTALVPIFGAFIGCVIGAFLILIVDPVMALWFIVMFLVIQQIEGNLIYPRVVGGSIGLPGMWVLVAVTIGGSTMGIPGMLIFIPMSSVLYTLLREAVNTRIVQRKIPKEKM